MRKLFYFLIFIVFFSIKCFSATVYIYDNVGYDEGNGYDWINNQMCICKPGDCNDCRVIIFKDEKDAVINELPTGGWKIITNIDQILFKTIGHSPSIEKSTDNTAGFEFSSNFFLKVKECTEYPELVNVTINLNGIVVDNNENITVYVPPMQ